MGLWGLYVLYALFVSPWMVPKIEIGEAPFTLGPRPALSRLAREMAEKHLASQAWAANPKLQLRTKNAFVYAEEWKPADSEKSVRFKPFAMIWQQTGKQVDEAPITIVSESAVVTFTNTFSIAAPDPGPVVGGALEGRVRIRGPKGLTVTGRDFAFSRDAQRIWSEHPVSFTYGPHHGQAKGVQIELVVAEQPDSSEKPAISGIRSIRLRQNVSMDLVFKGRKQEKKPVLVRIRSAGGFQYVVETNIATFEDNVRVFRPTDAVYFDSLQCDLLTLVFEPKEGPPQTAGHDSVAASGDERFSGLGDDLNLTFRRLRAEGKRVVLISETNKLAARMTELIYDAQSKVAALADPSGVNVTHESSQLSSPEITLSHDDDGKIVSAWCRGAGWLKYHDRQTGALQFRAQWAKLLHKYPDRRTGLDVIELQQQAVVLQPQEKTGLAAEFIKLWIDRQGKNRDAGNANATDGSSERIRPKRLLALRNVAINSPQLQVKRTNQLDVVWFAEGSQSQPPPPVRPVRHTRPDRLRPAIRRISYQPQRGATDRRRPAATQIPGEGPRKQDEPLEVTADRIRVHMVPGGARNESEVSDIWTEGHVDLCQQREPQTDALRLTGDRLHLQNRGEGDQVLHLFGQPAHIRGPQMHIEGGEVHLDRNRNLAWVSGAGLLEIPVQRDLDGEPLENSKPLDVWWKEQMTFDGELARFFGNVRAELGDSSMNCQEMQVRLTEKLSFTDDQQQQPNVEIRNVLCKDGVEFNSYEYQANKLIGVRRARFGEFTVNQLSGNFGARGPGWITDWRRGRGNRAALSPVDTVQANQPLEPESADWEYTRIDFAGQADGNITDRVTEFHDRVQIVYGPVQRPLVSIDPDDLPKKGGWMRCDTLQVTQHENAETQSNDIHLKAEGNAKLEGRTFHARAHRITYDESKRFFVLSSQGNPKATIWRQTQLGGELEEAKAQRIEFFPEKNHLKLDHTTGLHGG